MLTPLLYSMSEKFDIEKDLTIQNIVGSGTIPVEIDVDSFAKGMESHFDYKHFESREDREEASNTSKKGGYTWKSSGSQPGLYYEVGGPEGPQVTFHASGSYIIRADSKEELDETNRKVVDELKEMGIIEDSTNIGKMDFNIENVVALVKLDRDIKLRALHRGLGGRDDDAHGSDAQYEPEVFPALDYSTPKYPCTFLVYGNGKIVAAGSDSIEEAKEAMEKFYQEMDDVYFSIVDQV